MESTAYTKIELNSKYKTIHMHKYRASSLNLHIYIYIYICVCVCVWVRDGVFASALISIHRDYVGFSFTKEIKLLNLSRKWLLSISGISFNGSPVQDKLFMKKSCICIHLQMRFPWPIKYTNILISRIYKSSNPTILVNVSLFLVAILNFLIWSWLENINYLLQRGPMISILLTYVS